MTEQELFDLKEKVEDAKTAVSELKGQLTALKKQLKDDWECSTIEEAETKLETMGKSIDKYQSRIDKSVAELEEKYNVEE